MHVCTLFGQVLAVIAALCLHLPFGIHSVRFTLSTYCTIDPNKTPPILAMLFWVAMGLESFLFSNSLIIALNIVILWRILGASADRLKLVCSVVVVHSLAPPSSSPNIIRRVETRPPVKRRTRTPRPDRPNRAASAWPPCRSSWCPSSTW